MTNKQHHAQFDWATELLDAQGHVTLSAKEAHEIGARLRSMGEKLNAYEDLDEAASDVQLLRTGYAAARLEIESLQARIKTLAEEHADELMVAHLDGRMRAAQPAPAQAAPAAVAGPSEFPHEQMDAVALARYKVVPSHESMFHRHAVVAGDGSQQLYIGREAECQNMARKFAGAFLDGAFAFHSMLAAAPTPPAQAADSVLEDAARLKEAVWLLEELADHDNYSTEYDGRMLYICPECGEQDGEHRASCAFVRAKAFLAARKQGANHDQ